MSLSSKAASAFLREPPAQNGVRRAELCSNGLLVHVPAVSPREVTGTTALQPGYRRGPGAVYKYWAFRDIVDVLSDFVDKAQTKFDGTRHAESNAAHKFSMFQLFLEDQLAQLNRALKKAKLDVAEFTASLGAEKGDLVEAEKSLSAFCQLR